MMDAASSSGDKDLAVDQPYLYIPLPPGDFFRSLALQPGSGDEPLRCSIRVSAIADTDYEALSYVWGSGVKNQRVYCDDRIVNITTNLCLALRRLRRSNEIRHLWADSVCIDQENIKEKSRQVAIMGQIYRSARRVLIYIGPDPNGHGTTLASLLSDTHRMIQRELAMIDATKWNSFPDLHEDREMSLLHDERWQSYVVLFEQEWFKRGWVVREAGLARDGLIIWGDSQCSWDTLMYTVHWVQGKRVAISTLTRCLSRGFPDQALIHRDIYWDRNHISLRIFFSPKSVTPIRLLDHIAHGRHLQFGDRRDNIYAFLDLENSSTDRLQMVPDYTQSPNQTFTMFATQYIRATGDISILNYVVHDPWSMHSDVPTWVPKWEEIKRSHDDGLWRFTTEFLHQCGDAVAPEIVGGILKVQGSPFDKVHFVTDILKGSPTTAAVLYKQWQDIRISVSQTHQQGQYSIQDYVRFLAHYKVSRPGDDEGEEQRYIDSFIEEMVKPINEPRENVRERAREEHRTRYFAVLYYIERFSRAKRIMITENGHMGLAPAEVCEGDVCVRLFGSTALPKRFFYLLRTTEQADRYQFVGPGRLSQYGGSGLADNGTGWNPEGVSGGRKSESGSSQTGYQYFYLC